MAPVSAENLQKLCNTVSGHALKIAIDGITAEQISQTLGDRMHRLVDAQDPTVFDDKMTTIVTGVENLSSTAFVCFISKMDSLRFRNVLLFPTIKWFEAEECELTAWARFDRISTEKFRDRVMVIDVEGF